MIRYSVSLKDLRSRIEAQTPGWLARAALKTEEFRAKGRYEEPSSIWSEIKAVYMRLQGQGKCAYCERKLESVVYGKVEQDVEHFRPKASVKAWPGLKSFTGMPFSAAPTAGQGYYLLPYHLFNYAAACKPCNSTLKKDYFPVAAAHKLSVDDPKSLVDEQAYLVYPIGSIDEDPERLIGFEGTSPRARARSGHRRNRALVTIAFFKLDDEAGRKNLFRERAMVLLALYPQLEKATHGTTPTERSKAQAVVDGFERSDHVAHANCARSYIRLYRTRPVTAREFYEAAGQLVLSIS